MRVLDKHRPAVTAPPSLLYQLMDEMRKIAGNVDKTVQPLGIRPTSPFSLLSPTSDFAS